MKNGKRNKQTHLLSHAKQRNEFFFFVFERGWDVLNLLPPCLSEVQQSVRQRKIKMGYTHTRKGRETEESTSERRRRRRKRCI